MKVFKKLAYPHDRDRLIEHTLNDCGLSYFQNLKCKHCIIFNNSHKKYSLTNFKHSYLLSYIERKHIIILHTKYTYTVHVHWLTSYVYIKIKLHVIIDIKINQ